MNQKLQQEFVNQGQALASHEVKKHSPAYTISRMSLHDKHQTRESEVGLQESHIIKPQFLHRMTSQEEWLPILDLDISTNSMQ